MTSHTAVQHHTRCGGNSRDGGQRHPVPATWCPYCLAGCHADLPFQPAVLDEATRPRYRENRPAHALMPPFLWINSPNGSESGLCSSA
jgi:hypothetical protein